MAVSDAAPADVYVDPQGKLWRCIAICHTPTVVFEAVEAAAGEQPEWQKAVAAVGIEIAAGLPGQPQHAVKAQKFGGITGAMWQGWKRIHRPES